MNEKEKVAQVLNDTAQILRKTASERDSFKVRAEEAEAKVAGYARYVRSEKLAAAMHQKGIHTDIDFPTLVASLEKSASEGKDLDTIEQAVDMVGPDRSVKTASSHDSSSAALGTEFEKFLVGGIG